MYKIVLVDDEHIELETLKSYVPWEEMGLEVAGVARNGREALAKVEELSPDVVMTDVRMPLMDGIQFAREARKRWPHLIIIFMSGYDDFAYVKSALLLGAADYLLKPLDLDELEALVANIKVRAMEEERNRLSARALAAQYTKELLHEKQPQLLQNDILALNQLLEQLMPSAADMYSLAVIFFEAAPLQTDLPPDAAQLSKKAQHELLRLSASTQSLIVEWSDGRFVGLFAPSAELVMPQWHESLLAICPWTVTVMYPQPIALNQLYEACTHLQQLRGRQMTKQSGGQYILATALAPEHTDRHTGLMHHVQSLIDREYGNSLTIEYLAEAVYLSPNHLRTLFKDYTGFTVLEYMTKVRMERAAELLRDTGMKIHEISSHVGYESASHFCSVFLKKRGVTPNQYRNQMH